MPKVNVISINNWIDDQSDSDDSDSDDEYKFDDENEEEVIMDEAYNDNITLYDLEKYKLTYEIMCNSITIGLIDEQHYIPINKLKNTTSNIRVMTEYSEDIEKFKMFKSMSKSEIKNKKQILKQTTKYQNRFDMDDFDDEF